MKKEKSKKIKECLSYKISVEGENCEVLYFDHLQELINDYEPAKYKVSFDVKPKNPLSFAKSRTTQYAKKGKKTDGYIKFIHVQDIEDYYSQYHKNKFEKLIDEIEDAKKQCKISCYDLAYTNYSFDLWMVIHKYDLNTSVDDRHKYFHYINRGYNKNYQHMDDYKNYDEFLSVVSQIKIEDVITAVNRGHAIRNKHIENGDHLEVHNKFGYYRDNPDMSIHLIIEFILKDCGIL